VITLVKVVLIYFKFQLNEGKSAYKMIRMQLQDLPLLLTGALGAAITGLVAAGLSFLFGEIQKVTTLIYQLNYINELFCSEYRRVFIDI